MSTKRDCAVPTSMEFLRSKNMSIENKCKEFWKYLDDKNTLEPYQPPKLTEEEKEVASSSANSTCKSYVKPTLPCLGAKPKQPAKKPTPPKKKTTMEIKLDKIMREGLEPYTYEQSFESLLAEMDDFDKRIGTDFNCEFCKNLEWECTCAEAPKET